MFKKFLEVVFKGVASTSDTWKLDLVDFLKVARTASYVGGSALVMYVIEHAGEYDLGRLEPYVLLGLTALAEVITRLIKSNK